MSADTFITTNQKQADLIDTMKKNIDQAVADGTSLNLTLAAICEERELPQADFFPMCDYALDAYAEAK